MYHDHQTIRPSDHQTIRPSDYQTIRPSDPQTLRPSDPQTLRPSDNKRHKHFRLLHIIGIRITELCHHLLFFKPCCKKYGRKVDYTK